MMKLSRYTALLAVVRLLFSAAHAATATPAAATNYLFTTPQRPAAIRGLVMGSPPAYYVVRSEDFDWLNEALEERLCYMGGTFPNVTNTTLAAEFGKWDLDATNRFYRWATAVDAAGVTNVVVGYHLVTNTPPTSGSPGATVPSSYLLIGAAAGALWNPTAGPEAYLDPDVPLATGAHAYNSFQVWTNIYSIASYTNALTNAFSTISIPMTNGTVSVHTNQWHGYLPAPHDIVHTNVIQAWESLIHFCHVGNGPFPGYTNAPPFASASWGMENLRRFGPTAIISNDYVALRGAVRLADRISWPTNAPARSTYREHYSGVAYTNDVYESYADITPWNWTSDSTSVSTNLTVNDWLAYSFQQSHSVWETSASYKTHDSDGYEWIEGADVTERTIGRREQGRVSGTAVFETRFPSDLATIGGTTRIAVEAMYASVWFHYDNHSLSNYEDGVEIYSNVVVRLAGPVLDVSGKTATVKAQLDSRAICASAAQAAGAPAPPSSLDGDPGEERAESWWISRDGFAIFYRISPSSKLDGWQ